MTGNTRGEEDLVGALSACIHDGSSVIVLYDTGLLRDHNIHIGTEQSLPFGLQRDIALQATLIC